jgi:hypothetical protein
VAETEQGYRAPWEVRTRTGQSSITEAVLNVPLCCRIKGKFWDKFFEQSNQGLDSLKCLSQNVGLKTVVLSLITVLSLAARTTSLIMHANGTAEPLASPPPQDKTNGPEI